MGVKSRVINGVAANALSKFWILCVQLTLLPALLSTWGTEGYGIWILLTSFISYIRISDFGLNTALAVELNRSVTNGNYEKSKSLFQTVWLSVLLLSLSLVSLAIAAIVFLGLPLPDHGFDAATVKTAAIIISVDAVIVIQINVYRAVFPATKRYALGELITGFTFPVEGMIVLLTALAGGDIADAALSVLSMRVSLLAFYIVYLRKKEPWCATGVSCFSLPVLQSIWKPALGAFVFSISNAVSIHGLVISIGYVYGATVVGMFAAIRMITRSALQIGTLVSRALVPELTRYQESGDRAGSRSLMKVNLIANAAAVLPLSMLVMIFGDDILQFLSEGKYSPPQHYFVIMSVSAALSSFWIATSAVLTSMNKQSEFAYFVVSVYLAVVLTPFCFPSGLSFVLGSVAVAETLILLRVIFRSVNHLKGMQ